MLYESILIFLKFNKLHITLNLSLINLKYLTSTERQKVLDRLSNKIKSDKFQVIRSNKNLALLLKSFSL